MNRSQRRQLYEHTAVSLTVLCMFAVLRRQRWRFLALMINMCLSWMMHEILSA